MHELIKLSQQSLNDEVVSTVNARELHQFLESKQEFANWIKKRIEKYEFIRGEDFLTNLSKSPGRPSIEYYISLDMAKELAMVENNEKGKEARKYFIQCEKKLRKVLSNKSSYQLNIINASTEADRMIALNEYEIGYVKPLEQFKEQALPKVDIYDAIIESKNTFSMANTAQIINIEKMGRNKLLAWLRAKDVLKSDNTPYQKYVNKGWFEVRLTPTVNGPKPCSRTTPKGIEGILKMFE